MNEFGTVRIKLNELLQKTGMSKNALSFRAQVQRTQLNRFCRNEITRLDTDVLARFCCALGCSISDLLEYIPPEAEQNREE